MTSLRTIGTALVLEMSVFQTSAAQAQRVSFITVDSGVTLEVLDWGGSGRPVVLLAGNSQTAHSFDEFGPALGDRKSTRLNSSHPQLSRMPSSA